MEHKSQAILEAGTVSKVKISWGILLGGFSLGQSELLFVRLLAPCLQLSLSPEVYSFTFINGTCNQEDNVQSANTSGERNFVQSVVLHVRADEN